MKGSTWVRPWRFNAVTPRWFQRCREFAMVDVGGVVAYVPGGRPAGQFFGIQMFTFLLVVHAIIAAALVTVILMQRSEGGGLTSGGSPAGLMSARGAADFLTRATAVLATLFVLMSIALAVISATRSTTSVDTSLQRAPVTAPAAQPQQPVNTAPAAPPPADNGVPLAH